MKYIYEITAIAENGVETIYGDHEKVMELVDYDVVLQVVVKAIIEDDTKALRSSDMFAIAVIDGDVTTYKCVTEEEMFNMIHAGEVVTEISPCLAHDDDACKEEVILPMY